MDWKICDEEINEYGMKIGKKKKKCGMRSMLVFENWGKNRKNKISKVKTS
jgi:hypothetical protein